MTQEQIAKLERLQNRGTRYELVMQHAATGEKLRLRYALRQNRRSLQSAVSDLAKELVALSGAKEVVFSGKGSRPEAQLGDWRLFFSGRTEREAIQAGELVWFWAGRE